MTQVANDPPEWHKWYVLSVIIIMFPLLVKGFKTTETVAFTAMVVIWNAGIITTSDALGGFSNTGMLAVGVLFVVIQAVERSQLAPWAAKNVFGLKSGVRAGLTRLCLLCFFLSAFLNNTPVVALLTPITRDWARTRGFAPSHFLIPLSYATILGGLLTIIGTSTNLVVVALASDIGLPKPGFFEIGKIGAPTGLVGIIYLVIFAPILLPKAGGMFRDMKDRNKELITEAKISSTFAYKGRPAEVVLTSLGLHREVLIKIRRAVGVQSPVPDTTAPSNIEIQIPQDSGSGHNDRTAPIRSSSFSHRILGRSSVPEQETPNALTDNSSFHEIGGDFVDIYPVPPNLQVLEGDTGGRSTMMTLHAASAAKGLAVIIGDAPELGSDGLQFFELVLSNKNAFVGDVVSRSSFGGFYGCSLLALRRKGRDSEALSSIARPNPEDVAQRRRSKYEGTEAADGADELLEGSPSIPHAVGDESPNIHDEGIRPLRLEVGHSKLSAGDVVLVLASQEFGDKWADSDDFLMVTGLGAVPKPPRPYDYVPVLVFIAMIAWVSGTNGKFDMVQCAMSAASLLIMGGWIDAKKAVSYVPWDLLLLIGSMLGISKAITSSGLSDMIGEKLKETGMAPTGALYVIYLVTTLMTEVTTNNAAAGLMFPLAMSIAKKYDVSYLPFMYTIMAAASASFITPIGYQTNMMVWGPGGYKFWDFTKIGLPLNMLHMVITCLLALWFWPLANKFDWSTTNI